MDQITPRLKPKVSINMATYNRGQYLSEAIDSVLNQDFTDWELIIVDDGSTDNTQEVILPYLRDERIKYFKNEKNLGICLTRNRALEKSAGEYIAVLDSDDVWLAKDKLSQQVDFLDFNYDYVLVGTGVVVIDEKGKEIKRYLNPEATVPIKNSLLAKNSFAHSSVLYRRETAIKLGAYPLNLNGIEDYDLWLRLGSKYKLHNLPLYHLGYRKHAGNISQTDRIRLMTSNLDLVKKYQKYYPNFYWAWLRRSGRLFIAEIFSLLGIHF
jgi:glycosyltransferase involved in cell wall biosynthesis